MLHERNQMDGIASNPNNIITNLSNHILSSDEYNILKYGLKYGISFSPKSLTVLAYSEDVWDQIRKSNIYYNNEYAKMKIRTHYDHMSLIWLIMMTRISSKMLAKSK